MVTSSGPSITNYYDGHKRRVRQTEAGSDRYTLYGMGGSLLQKKAGGVSTDYIYAGSLLVAKKEGTNVHYLHTDLLGSPIDGKVGSTSYTENYRPWGEKWDNPIQLSDDVGYTGHQSDVATGLTYMQARYYDPVVGRFMAVDPVAFSGSNPSQFGRYTYANDNPFKFVDPDGRAADNFFEKFLNSGPVIDPGATAIFRAAAIELKEVGSKLAESTADGIRKATSKENLEAGSAILTTGAIAAASTGNELVAAGLGVAATALAVGAAVQSDEPVKNSLIEISAAVTGAKTIGAGAKVLNNVLDASPAARNAFSGAAEASEHVMEEKLKEEMRE